MRETRTGGGFGVGMASPTERRSRDYGFKSIDSMRLFFSRWIPSEELDELVQETESRFRPRKDVGQEETRLQRIQKAEFAIVRRLVDRHSPIP